MRCKVAEALAAGTYVPSDLGAPGWEIWAGFVAGVVPFAIGSWEFGKRIVSPSCWTVGVAGQHQDFGQACGRSRAAAASVGKALGAWQAILSLSHQTDSGSTRVQGGSGR